MQRISGIVTVYFILVGALLVAVAMSSPANADELPWWNETYDFRQKITLPSTVISSSQSSIPIDFAMNFSNPCWVKNPGYHSIRIVYQTNDTFKEIESQIYNLNFSEETLIKTCSIVFLLPDDLTGKEVFFVYYDDQETNKPDYPDRVNLQESNYQYEPVKGYRLESWFYAIVQEESMIYTVAQEGSFMGNPISQQVTKMKPNTNSFSPQHIEQTASFALSYWYKNNNDWEKITTAETLLSKEILIDGNLMVKFGIVSSSENNVFETMATYTYYYAPGEQKRLQVEVSHELIDTAPSSDAIDVFFGSMTSGGFSSSTYEDLNFGTIPPYLHIYTIDNQTAEYTLTTNPDGKWGSILGRKANVELGEPGWFSLDNGNTGQAHALLLFSNSVLKKGIDEQDGVEIQAYEEKLSETPGVTSTSVYVYLSRNTYEPTTGRDSNLPQNYAVYYTAEFFSDQNSGYEFISTEADLFSSLVELRPIQQNNISGNGSQKGSLSLTLYPHLTPGLYLKYLSSKIALTGSSIIAELYRDETLYASSVCGRIEMNNESIMNLDNISLFLNAQFTHLPEGSYLVKIFLQNSLFANKNKFIGLATIDLNANDSIHILCRRQGTIQLKTVDQQNNGLADVTSKLYLDNMVVTQAKTDENGETSLYAPCSLFDYDYTIESIYKGFVIDQTSISLGYTRSIIPLSATVTAEVYDATFTIQKADTSRYTSPVTISLTSEAMDYPITISPSTEENGQYQFKDLPTANYLMNLDYTSFCVQQLFFIQNNTDITIQLNDLHLTVKDTWNLSIAVPLEVFLSNDEYIQGTRLSADTTENGSYLFSNLYSASYNLTLRYKSFTVEKKYNFTETTSITETIDFPATYNLSITLYDNHGLPLKQTTAKIQRENKTVSVQSSQNADIHLSLPPASYTMRIIENNHELGKRNVSITNHKSFSFVTQKQPLYPILIWISAAIIILLAGIIILWKKQNLQLFIFISVLCIFFSLIIFPMWTYNGTSNNIEQTTKIYVVPYSFVSFTETPQVKAGEILTPTEEVTTLTILTEILLWISGIIILFSIIFYLYNWKKTMILLLFLSIILLCSSLALFYSTMNAFTEASFGSVIGSDSILTNIPGEQTAVILQSTWGLGIGYYATVAITLILIVFFIRMIFIQGYFDFIIQYFKRN